jgi:predicted nucleic acid-binding protein
VIVLDTNVLSELMRARPDDRVIGWIDAQPADELWLTSVTVGEILHGIARLPAGRRRSALLELATELFSRTFEGRCLSFDVEAAFEYAALVATREALGRPISVADAQIAAMCLHHEATLATRNGRDFAGLGMELVDPWRASARS